MVQFSIQCAPKPGAFLLERHGYRRIHAQISIGRDLTKSRLIRVAIQVDRRRRIAGRIGESAVLHQESGIGSAQHQLAGRLAAGRANEVAVHHETSPAEEMGGRCRARGGAVGESAIVNEATPRIPRRPHVQPFLVDVLEQAIPENRMPEKIAASRHVVQQRAVDGLVPERAAQKQGFVGKIHGLPLGTTQVESVLASIEHAILEQVAVVDVLDPDPGFRRILELDALDERIGKLDAVAVVLWTHVGEQLVAAAFEGEILQVELNREYIGTGEIDDRFRRIGPQQNRVPHPVTENRNRFPDGGVGRQERRTDPVGPGGNIENGAGGDGGVQGIVERHAVIQGVASIGAEIGCVDPIGPGGRRKRAVGDAERRVGRDIEFEGDGQRHGCAFLQRKKQIAARSFQREVLGEISRTVVGVRIHPLGRRDGEFVRPDA